MSKVASIDRRKAEHIKINLEQNVRSRLSSGLERYHFIHEALPEINLEEVDTTTTLFGKKLNAPVLISSMTGGTGEALIINKHLASAAQVFGVAMGVGSQRAAIEDPSMAESFSIVRKTAPNILLFANIGAIQLNYGFTIDDCQRAIDMIGADGLILHLNPLQEALQYGGNTDFAGLAGKIEWICEKLDVPVIVKEVGWGISERTAKILAECGVSAIDVAGAGGTSWSQVEMHRAPDDFTRQLAESFVDWGITTADSIRNVKYATPGMTIFGSGGLRNGVDVTKAIALGATLGGMAAQFLKTAVISAESTIDLLKLTQRQIMVTLFACGVKSLKDLNLTKLNSEK